MCDKVFKPLQLEHKVQKYETILDALQVILGLSSDELETLPSLLLEAWQHEEEDVRSVQNLVKSLATLQQRTAMQTNGRMETILGRINAPINASQSKFCKEKWRHVDRGATMVR
jgi:hypothetical protein